jgi:tetratricopeptide (TPR) repeat protein
VTPSAAPDLVITAFEAPRDPEVAAWGRQVPALLYERLAGVGGVRARLSLEGAGAPPRGRDALLEGAVEGGAEVRLVVRLTSGVPPRAILEREDRFPSKDLFERLDRLAADVARALGASPPPARLSRGTASFPALRDYLRAIDLAEESDLPLELEDRRRKLEWLLLAVEADPAFRPAADALLEAGLRAHESGLFRESRKALELLARLAPLDSRAPYVLGELALLHGSVDEAQAYFQRCVARAPEHRDARFRLGLMADEEGDRESAKSHFRAAGAGEEGRAEALVLLGILCAEDGDREAARAAWARAAELDPRGRVGLRAAKKLERPDVPCLFPPARRRSRRR